MLTCITNMQLTVLSSHLNSTPFAAQDIVSKPFARVSYTDAIQLLLKAKAKFQYPVQWGADLQSEHERYLTEKEFDGTPLFVTDYPKDIKVEPGLLFLSPGITVTGVRSNVAVPQCT